MDSKCPRCNQPLDGPVMCSACWAATSDPVVAKAFAAFASEAQQALIRVEQARRRLEAEQRDKSEG